MRPGRIILKRGREKSVLNRHPWIFSGAVDRIEGNPASGDTCHVVASNGTFLAQAAYSPHSQITARIWSFDPEEQIDRAFFLRTVRKALDRRKSAGYDADGARSAFRLVFAESDGLPGFVADRYADVIVCQLLSAGAEFWKNEIVSAIAETVSCTGIYERSDTAARIKEGFAASVGVLWGRVPDETIPILENGLRFQVDIRQGHKTGFYLDQAENRRAVADYCTGKSVLNAFCYTGAFGIHALRAGAEHVVQMDASEQALDAARRHADMNGFSEEGRVRHVCADVFEALRRFRDRGETFDAVILDPPKFAESKAQVERACRGYKDINLLAMKLIRRGGILATFSCSGMISPALFQKVVADAACDAKREARILRWCHQGADHPVALSFPEGLYLKGLICRIE
ncbi:class I SAM-dependent rRNA methyltransferase [Desulfatirhabdium butyrativorans]|uniref:class I SAM-dependent rRNA methyltransferase n=1 Tax=Desulfatirhabdium butyrativorans TaxID=340467 RepID=UPI00040A829A|nr:class I SAM-dependent methyltransferase [Desulfatirhabdium butyrativorans]